MGRARTKPQASEPQALLADIHLVLTRPVTDDALLLLLALGVILVATLHLRLVKQTMFWFGALAVLLPMPPLALWRPDTALVLWAVALVAAFLQRGDGWALSAQVKELRSTCDSLREEVALVSASLRDAVAMRGEEPAMSVLSSAPERQSDRNQTDGAAALRTPMPKARPGAPAELAGDELALLAKLRELQCANPYDWTCQIDALVKDLSGKAHSEPGPRRRPVMHAGTTPAGPGLRSNHLRRAALERGLTVKVRTPVDAVPLRAAVDAVPYLEQES